MLPIMLIPYTVVFLGHIYFLQPLYPWGTDSIEEPGITFQLFTGAIVYLIDVGSYEALHLFVQLKQSKLKEEQLKTDRINSELIGLKAQLNPHFLFNSLNTLAFLIEDDPVKSKEFVRSLANVYQKVSTIAAQPWIYLDVEVDYIKDYIQLLKKRHGYNLAIDIAIQPNHLKKRIVPLALQVSLENAIKHNVVSKNKPLHIYIETRDDFIAVTNTLQRKTKNSENGIGLKNIKNRYEFLTNELIQIKEDKKSYTIKFPLLD